MDLFSEVMMEHYWHPRNKGELKKKNANAKDFNPSCGDRIEMQFFVENGVIKDIRFKGEGCLISQASSSILTEQIKGKKLADVMKMKKEKFLELLGIQISPARLK